MIASGGGGLFGGVLQGGVPLVRGGVKGWVGGKASGRMVVEELVVAEVACFVGHVAVGEHGEVVELVY